MPSFSWVLIGLLALSPFVTYGAMAVRETIVVAGAVQAEATRQAAACEARVSAIAAEASRSAAAKVEAARAAAGAVGATPQARAELIALCNRSASCRDRKGD